jgi:hypothetical protein
MPVIGGALFCCGHRGPQIRSLELFRGLAQRTKGRKTRYLDALSSPARRGKPLFDRRVDPPISWFNIPYRPIAVAGPLEARDTAMKPFLGTDETMWKQTKGT